MQIGIVAKKIGLSVEAIRFYERNGLLPRPARDRGWLPPIRRERYGNVGFCPARAGPGIQTERGSNQVGLPPPEVSAQTQ
jgi:hypothetical protein